MLIHERLQRIINNSVLCTYSVGGMYVAENYNIVCKLLWQNVDFATQHFHIIVDRIDYCIIGSAKEDGDNGKVLHRLCTVYREYSMYSKKWMKSELFASCWRECFWLDRQLVKIDFENFKRFYQNRKPIQIRLILWSYTKTIKSLKKTFFCAQNIPNAPCL